MSCIAVFCMATLYEGLKVLREYLIRRSLSRVRYDSVAVPTTENSTSESVHYKSVRSVYIGCKMGCKTLCMTYVWMQSGESFVVCK